MGKPDLKLLCPDPGGGWLAGRTRRGQYERQCWSGVFPVYHIAIQNDGANGQIGPEAAGSLVQLIDQRVQAVMLSMRRDGGMLSG